MRLADVDVLKECIISPRCNGKSLLMSLIDSIPTVDAIPIEWLKRKMNEHKLDGFAWIFEAVIDEWRREHD